MEAGVSQMLFELSKYMMRKCRSDGCQRSGIFVFRETEIMEYVITFPRTESPVRTHITLFILLDKRILKVAAVQEWRPHW